MAFRAALLLLLLGLASVVPGTAAAARNDRAAESKAEEDLERIRSEIKAVESRVRRDTDRRSALDRDLREAEQSATAARRNLTATRKALSQAQQERLALLKAMDQARRDLQRQREALAAQIQLAHRNGPGARLKILLSEEEPADAGRRLQYLAYLARQRSQSVEAVKTAIAALDESRLKVEAQTARLVELEEQQARELKVLEAARGDRAAVLAKAKKQGQSNDAKLRQLRRQATDVQRLIRDLQRAIARQAPPAGRTTPSGPADSGKPMPRGRWPVDGRLLADFGQARAGGQMRWDGVLIAAPAGTAVRAARPGRVVYADWLPGLGLLMVLDHGKGVMSLYGHNQELDKSVGERVVAGDTIARVGDTGGQSRPALYFEVRRNGRPQNPHQWVR